MADRSSLTCNTNKEGRAVQLMAATRLATDAILKATAEVWDDTQERSARTGAVLYRCLNVISISLCGVSDCDAISSWAVVVMIPGSDSIGVGRRALP